MNAVNPNAAQITHVTLPNASTTALGSEQSMSYQQIMPLLNNLQPGQFTQAADAFLQLGQALETVRQKMQAQGEALAANKSWTGSAAHAAMRQFQQLHDQAAALSQQATQTGTAIQWFGSEATPPFKAIQPPQVMSQTASDILGGGAVAATGGAGFAEAGAIMGLHSDGQNKADKAARGYMAAYNQQIAKLNQALPHTISGTGQQSGGQWGAGNQGSGSGTGSGAGAGSGYGYGGVGGTNGTGGTGGALRHAPSGVNPFSSSKLPGGGAGPNASLQGYAPPPSGTTTSPFGGGATGTAATGGSGVNPFAAAPAMADGFSGYGGGAGAGSALGEDVAGLGKSGLGADSALGDGTAGAGGLGTEGASAGADGAAGAAGDMAAADAAGAAGGGEGMAGMPMGGGGGSQDNERARQAWMAEDTSIWGAPGTDIGPVIG